MRPQAIRGSCSACSLVSLCVLLGALACATATALATQPESPCPNAQLRIEQPFASALPDCRAYEMVSPLGKDDNGVAVVGSRAAIKGEAVTYFSSGSFANPTSAFLESRYISRRGARSWSAQNISPPYVDYEEDVENFAFAQLLFTPDLSMGMVQGINTPLVEGESVGYVNLYVAAVEDGSYQVVSRFTPEDEYEPFSEGHGEAFAFTPRVEGAFNRSLSCCL